MRGFWYVPIIPRSPSEKYISLRGPSCRTAKHPNFKQLSFLLISKGCILFSDPPSATFSEMHFPFSAFQPTPSSLHPSKTIELWSAGTQIKLIHLKLTGRPDYGGGFLLQTSYRHHLSRNTCRNMKELPSSISWSIVCRMCQQTEGKLSYAHLSPGV